MSQNPAAPVSVSDSEVMASVDQSDAGERLVIAELSRNGAYLSMSTDSTVLLDEWE